MNMNNPQEEFKRKYIGINTVVKNNPMGNQLISGRDRKKSQVSKEKQNKKIITAVDKQIKPKQKTPNIYYEQCQAKFNLKTFNFRNLKENALRRQADLTKTQQPPYTKTNRQYFQKNINVKRKVPTQQPQGIQINVNIQNMALLKNKINPIEQIHQTNKKSDRSFLNQQNPSKSRKVQKINNYVKNDDFQCTEQLVVKVTTDTTKTKIMEKQPLITRKPFQRQSPHQIKDTVLDPKQVLKKFQEQMNNINSTSQQQTIHQLDIRQQSYIIPPHYIQKKQKNFSWIMRATLVQWMMHVSYEFSLKRQTFHLSVNLVDLYMSKQSHLSKAQFQLIGAAAMFIASKLQQFQPKCSQQFANSTSRYSAKQIKQQQIRICNKLKYNLNPPTLFMWANRFMLQWDHYLDMDYIAMNHQLFFHCQKVYFKKFDGGSSFKNFRILMQLLDCAILDIQTVQYKQKLLVCAFMYLVLGKALNQFKIKQIVNDFPRSSLYLLDQNNLFNDLFSNFLQISFGIVLIDLLPTIQYSATYFILNFTFDAPVAQDVVSSQIQLQEYCCLQTYNQNTKGAINKRFRGIYQ